MVMDDDRLLYYAAVCLCVKKKKPKSKWVKQWLLKRDQFTHANLLSDLVLEPSDWRNYLRMDEDSYYHLLRLVSPLIRKQDTPMRKAISPHQRLAATLRFLATGMNYEELKFVTAISAQRLGVIVPETCLAILKTLRDYMKMPETTQDWMAIADEFERRWNFPNCLGAVDGKHIRITPPPGSGSYFWNYKHFNSLVLMACANANYEFIWCEIGTNGRISDGGAIKNTEFYRDLIAGNHNFPPPRSVNGTIHELPYVLVGDEAFSLRPDFKPFNVKSLNLQRRIYNYRLSRARRVIENAFGILVNRFRILHTSIPLDLSKIEIIVLTCCVLHNFLRRNSTNYVTPEETQGDSTFDTPLTALENNSGNASNRAKYVREMFVDYFNGEGAVDWQNERVML